MAESLQLVWDLIARDSASPTFARVGASAEGASAGVGKLLGGLSALAVGGAIAASVKAAADFQAQMLLVQTQAGATAQEVADMSPKILALAGQVAQAPEALATSLYHVESTGLRGSAALDAVRVAAEGAKVGHADLEQTTNALTATIASGMLPATETYAQAMGQLNTIVGSGDMKMQDLNDALSSGLLVTVKQYGVNINDVGAALADFGDNNIRGADAATRLRMAVQAIAAPGKAAGFELGRIGLTVPELTRAMEDHGLNAALTLLHDHLQTSGIAANEWGDLLTQAFTKKAGGGIVTLMGTFDRFEQKYTEVSKGANTFGDAWAATTKTASFQFSALKDNVEAIGISLGEKLLPPISAFMGWLNNTAIPAVQNFGRSLSEAVQSPAFQSFLSNVEQIATQAWQAIQSFSGELVKLGQTILPPVLAVGGQLVSMFAGLPEPIQLAAAGFAALRIAAGKGMFDGLLSTFGSMRGAFRDFSADVSATSGVLRSAGVPFSGFAATLQTTAERGMGALKSAGTGVMNMLGGPWGASLAGATAVVALYSSAVQAAKDKENAWTDAIKQGGTAMEQAEAEMSKYTAFREQNTTGVRGFLNDMVGLGGAIRATTPDAKNATDQYNKWYQSLGLVDQKAQDVQQATANLTAVMKTHAADSLAVREAADKVRQAQSEEKQAQDDLNQSTKTSLQLTQEQASAELALTGSSLAVKQAYDEFSRSLQQYKQDAADPAKQSTLALQTESDSLSQSALGVAQSAGIAGKAWADANGVTDTATASQYAQLEALQKVQAAMGKDTPAAISTLISSLAQSVAQGHLTQTQMDGITTAVDGIPGQKNINVTADTSQAEQSLNSLITSYQHVQYTGSSIIVNGRVIANAAGNLLSPMAGGTAQVIKPGDLRVIGDNPTSPEAYIPINGSARSLSILGETAARMGLGLHAMANGGFLSSVDRFTAQPSQGWLNSIQSFGDNAVRSAATAALAAAPGGSVERLRPIVNAVLAQLGQSSALANGVLSLIQSESGGQSAIVNRWDSNWAAGHPSVGDMQLIAGTFARYAGPYRNVGPFLYGVSTNDMANIYAGTAYALANYGPAMLAGGGRHNSSGRYIGYERGTNYVPETGLALLHKGEAVKPATKQGAPYRETGPLVHVENQYVNDATDLDLFARQLEYRQRAGVFS